MKNKKKNNNVILLVLILALLFVLMLLTIRVIIKPKNKPQEIETKDRERLATTYIRPETISMISEEEFFKAYDGNLSQQLIMQKITDFIYYMVDNKTNIDSLSEKQVINKYNEEKDEINELGITTEEDYIHIIKMLQNLGEGEIEFSFAEINKDTIKNEQSNISAELTVKFIGIDKTYFMIYFNETDKSIPVSFKLIENS